MRRAWQIWRGLHLTAILAAMYEQNSSLPAILRVFGRGLRASENRQWFLDWHGELRGPTTDAKDFEDLVRSKWLAPWVGQAPLPEVEGNVIEIVPGSDKPRRRPPRWLKWLGRGGS